MSMRCLVLGGGGFIGSHITDALLAAGHAVRVFEKRGCPKINLEHALDKIQWQEGDFSTQADMERALEGIDAVLHLICTTLPGDKDPIRDLRENVLPTLEMLEAATRAGVKKVIFASSGGTVYGNAESVPISEDHPTNPTCPYGVGKLAIEKYLALYHQSAGLDYVALRVSNPYGQRQNPAGQLGAATVFLYRTLKGEQIEIWGDGSVKRDFVHISDVARAFVDALNYKGLERIFNIGSGKSISLNDLLAEIEKVTGTKPIVVRKAGRPFDVLDNGLDISLARQKLGWSPRISMSEGLAMTAAHMRL